MPITTVRDSDHLTAELTSAGKKLSVLDFTAKWCGPCQMISPEFDRLSEKHSGTKFFKVDVDECSDVAQEYDVRSMPTFVFVKDSKEVERFSGANTEKLEALILKHGTGEKFSGSGYTLSGESTGASSDGLGGWIGSLVNSVTGSSASATSASNKNHEEEEMNQNYEQQARDIFPVDKEVPTCKMQIRLMDGKKITVTMNNTQKVDQLREYITVARPAYEDLPFVFVTGHPPKVIEDESLSLESANLANAVVVLQLKK